MSIDAERHLTLHSPLGEDVLLVRKIEGSETLGAGYEYTLSLLSLDCDLKAEAVLGKHVTVCARFGEQEPRYCDGIACEFSHTGYQGRHASYRMVLRPSLWLLSRNQDCRIYQKQTALEILCDVFHRRGLADLELKLIGTFGEREYCVQYCETDLNFVHRIMREEGIYYYFTHELGKHVLVLADSPCAHALVPGLEKLSFRRQREEHTKQNAPSVHDWVSTKRLVTGAVATKDYDFKRPRVDLLATSKDAGQRVHPDTELYEYPAGYSELDAGERVARRRLDAVLANYEVAHGTTNATGLYAGALVALCDSPRQADNREYLITGVSFSAESGQLESGDGKPPSFSAHLQAIESSVAFHAPENSFRPKIVGAQTAVVVGPKAAEICTDQYARIKVQFHWDRLGQFDEASSCWIRVAQTWASGSWGSQFIPRVGQEVVVEFLEGDPDRPLVTGCVYNGRNAPPFKLPQNSTQSGIKTQSSREGGIDAYNEFRFEDLKGKEQLYLQAQRNMDTLVKHDQSIHVGGKRKKTIVDREDNVHQGGRESTIDKFDNLTVNSANKNTTVHGQYNIVADEHFKVQQNATQVFLKDKVYIESDGDIEFRNGGTHYRAQHGGKLSINVSNEISITCGAASIKLKKDGTIEITGTKVKIGTKTNNTQYEPPGITVSAAKISQAAVGIHEINGAIVKIG